MNVPQHVVNFGCTKLENQTGNEHATMKRTNGKPINAASKLRLREKYNVKAMKVRNDK